MSSRARLTEGLRARKIFRALNLPSNNISAPGTKRTKQLKAQKKEENIGIENSQQRTPVKRPCGQHIAESPISCKRTKSLPAAQMSLPASKISSSEKKCLDSMPLSPISRLQKSVSLSDLTQDNEAIFSLHRKFQSDLIHGHHNETVNENVWILFADIKDINNAVSCEQYTIKQNYLDSVRPIQADTAMHQVRSLSISDLTQDTEVQHKFTRCKSVPAMEKTNCYTLNNYSTLLSTKTTDEAIIKPSQKWKSLSLSNLTSDIMKFPIAIRKCKSTTAVTGTFISTHLSRRYELPESSDDDEEYFPSNDLEGSITDCESTVENLYGDLDEGKIRRRKAKPREWSRNKTKIMRMKGEEYVGYQKLPGQRKTHDIVRSARQLRETCNSDFCKRSKLRGCSQITEETRKKIHSHFWKTLTWDQRKIYINGLVTRADTNRKTVKNKTNSRRQGTLQYSLPLSSKGAEKVQVCREMFLNTLSLGSYTVQSWVKQSEFCMTPSQENSSRTVERNEESKQKMIALETFFNDLPKLPSHYARKDTSKLFLEPVFKSLSDLFKFYKEFCSSNNKVAVCRYTFEKRFNEKNLSLLTLKKDMCDTCSTWLAGNLNDADYQMHLIQKDRARKEKADDKKKAVKKECILLTMDLQSVKVCPYLTASALYFKTKLTCHNFTVYNLASNHCTCYWFNETAADLTANTFVSFLLDYLARHCLPLKLPIIFFSDGCTYQNRNVNLANALLNFSKLHGVTITQKFLIPGHTQMECDSVHSAIERKLKNREIHLPSNYSTVSKEARNDPPYEVVTIDHEFVKNYGDTETWVYKSIRPGRKVGDAQVTDIRAIKYTSDGKIQVKLDFDEDWFDLPQRQQVVKRDVIYQRLHSGPIPITSSKYNHLQQLKSVIPQDCHAFYDNLPKNNE